MRRIVHLSDLHFGRARAELVGPLLAAIATLRPDLVVVSGDLTQRARARQFAEARGFLDRLEAPWLAVPGNHDVPLLDPAGRLARPWARWRRWIGRDPEPVHADPEMVVVGVNTADPWSWQRGRMRPAALPRLAAVLAAGDGGRMRVVVAHHPFEARAGGGKAAMRGAGSLAALVEAGADLVLSGHLHAWRAAPFAARTPGHGALQVHAGSGLSSRLRGAANDFNLIVLEPGSVGVTRHAAAADAFAPAETARFERAGALWRRLTEPG